MSGLGPTAQTAANCPVFTDIVPGVANNAGQFTGSGCIYPSGTQTIGDQLAAKGLSWRVYAQDMAAGAPAAPVSCRHPSFGTTDATAIARPGDAFATFRDPFSYFDGVIDARGCANVDVDLSRLAGDLRSAHTTPALSYIVPDLCDDGRDEPCAAGAPAGLPAADGFLKRLVPEILASAAYKAGGLIVITTDQAPASGPDADSSSCCGQPAYPGPASNT